ncbi:hypothetical protein DIPPA_18747 [Diplonema papillatum]|nr:hypothetical protein DIPPA_18747 [Diplonema papillatum]
MALDRFAPHALDQETSQLLIAYVNGLTAMGADVPRNPAQPIPAADFEPLMDSLSDRQGAYVAMMLNLGLRWEGAHKFRQLELVSDDGTVAVVRVLLTSKGVQLPYKRNAYLCGVFREKVSTVFNGRAVVEGADFAVPYRGLLERMKRHGFTTHSLKKTFAGFADSHTRNPQDPEADTKLMSLTEHRQWKNVELYLGADRVAERRDAILGVKKLQTGMQQGMMPRQQQQG